MQLIRVPMIIGHPPMELKGNKARSHILIAIYLWSYTIGKLLTCFIYQRMPLPRWVKIVLWVSLWVFVLFYAAWLRSDRLSSALIMGFIASVVRRYEGWSNIVGASWIVKSKRYIELLVERWWYRQIDSNSFFVLKYVCRGILLNSAWRDTHYLESTLDRFSYSISNNLYTFLWVMQVEESRMNWMNHQHMKRESWVEKTK